MNRQLVGMRLAVVLFLPSIRAQSLAKVTISIKQTDPDPRQTELARRPEMIAREYSEAARVKRKRSVHAELRTEVRDWMFRRDLLVLVLPVRTHRHVRLENLIDATYALEIDGIGGGFGEPVGRRLCEQLSRVVLTFFPNFRIEIAENAGAVRRPAPPVVPRQSFKWFQRRGQSICPRRTLFHFSRFNHSCQNLAAAELESLLELLVLKKHAGITLLKKDESHFFDSAIRGQKTLDRRRRYFRSLRLGITVNAGRNGWECDRRDRIL